MIRPAARWVRGLRRQEPCAASEVSDPGKTGRAEIVDAYRWILGRWPSIDETEAAIAHIAGNGVRLQAFQQGLLSSEEFRGVRLFAQQCTRMAPIDLFRPKHIFVHIEKCGGTTLRTMLEARFGADRICPERFNGLADWTANELAGFDGFAGHYDLASTAVVPGRHNTVFTLLREPKARLLSLFHFWQAHLPSPVFAEHTLVHLAQRCTAEAFFAHPAVVEHPSIRDAMTGQLTRTIGSASYVDGFQILDRADPILAAPGDALEAAWHALTGMTCFGIVEQFEPSRRLLNQRLGLGLPQIEPQQVLGSLVSEYLHPVRPAASPMTEKLQALLDDVTSIDRALYRRATALFAKLVQ